MSLTVHAAQHIPTPLAPLPLPVPTAASNLWRLRELCGYGRDDPSHLQHLLARPIQDRLAPTTLPALVAALAVHALGPAHVIIAGDPRAADTTAMLRAAHSAFLPNRILVLSPVGDGDGDVAVRAAFAEVLQSYGGCPQVRGRATAYVCRNRTCSLPVTDAQQLASMLHGGGGGASGGGGGASGDGGGGSL
jgi:uncharacterized protein